MGQSCKVAQDASRANLGSENEKIASIMETLRAVYSVIMAPAVTAFDISTAAEKVSGLELEAVLKEWRDELQTKMAKISNLTEYQRLAGAQQTIAFFITYLPDFQKRMLHQHAITAKRDALARVVQHLVDARKRTVQGIVAEISEETNRLYRIVHPNEAVGAISLKVPDRRGQGSIEMEGEFYERRGDARLYYSESHLDTLGLAPIFGEAEAASQITSSYEIARA